jgi:hypothetical protein
MHQFSQAGRGLPYRAVRRLNGCCSALVLAAGQIMLEAAAVERIADKLDKH